MGVLDLFWLFLKALAALCLLALFLTAVAGACVCVGKFFSVVARDFQQLRERIVKAYHPIKTRNFVTIVVAVYVVLIALAYWVQTPLPQH
jgi:hypothetical protein